MRGGSNVGGIIGLSPVISKTLTSQSDFTTPITAGSLASTGNLPWMATA